MDFTPRIQFHFNALNFSLIFDKAKVSHELERAISIVALRISLLAKSFKYVLRTCLPSSQELANTHFSLTRNHFNYLSQTRTHTHNRMNRIYFLVLEKGI